ncbi:type IV pilin protein [Noviluteimonas gilva]|uniref:Prepilin-type N-terminal cleavage/methylation domain-containing protein n=1 Tax=Noviluteimonas gilva TaxID=2682097 RepID=A0A7C9HMD5_9GAMM|nr:type IV pilin protein [Lysobacter gilvus]MUV14417.1 prepilin-type N-terminal cleavage/methylation domain-containing protein [Lysobacter gilvus]
MKRKALGFTLLELMITVGIVAALAAMAVAGYGFATMKTRRAAAQGCLTEAAGALERYYTTAMTYQGGGWPDCSADVRQHYAIEFDTGSPAATSFTLRARPLGAQQKDKCGTMTLTNRNVRTPTTSGCW